MHDTGRNCVKPAQGKGYCKSHHGRKFKWLWSDKRMGEPFQKRTKQKRGICQIIMDDTKKICGKNVLAKNFCESHYQRKYKYFYPNEKMGKPFQKKKSS